MRALIVTCDLEGASRTRRAFLEDQDDFFAFQVFLLSARIFRTLQIACEIEEVPKLPLCKVLHRQQRPVTKIEAHLSSPRETRVLFSRQARAKSDKSCNVRRHGRGRAPSLAP